MQCARLPTPEEQVTTPGTVLPEDQESVHQLEPGPVELIPDCLEHIFKYLSTSDKGRASQVWHNLVVKDFQCASIQNLVAKVTPASSGYCQRDRESGEREGEGGRENERERERDRDREGRDKERGRERNLGDSTQEINEFVATDNVWL